MAKHKAFVSFDYGTDLQLKGYLISQAERPDSPFSVTDFSLQEAQPGGRLAGQSTECDSAF